VIDVGANRGQFALDVEAVLPETNVFSFEPMFEAAQVYRKLFSNNSLYSITTCALGSRAGTSTLHVSAADDSSSLLRIGAGQIALFPGTSERGTRVVDVEPLDAAIDPDCLVDPVLMKIDVQGYELEVLRGATRTLPGVRWVYVECSFEELYDDQPLAGEVTRWLFDHGFALVGIGPVTSTRDRVIQADLLFEQRSVCADEDHPHRSIDLEQT
jgi:FkbM family methyltransferase